MSTVKTIMLRLKMLGIIAAALLVLTALPCAAQTLGSTRAVQTPEELIQWFKADFRFAITVPDKPQTPADMVASRRGDCDDFAALASAMLSRMGIKNDIVIVKYRGLNIRHAICIWQNKSGTYSFISNQRLRHTGQSDLLGAIAMFFPDYESITYSSAGGQRTLR